MAKKRVSPEPVLRYGQPLWAASTLIAGVRLGVFGAIGMKSLTAAQLAKRCGASARGTFALADALAALGYLRFRGGRYSNSPAAKEYLLPGGEMYFGDMLLLLGEMMGQWSRLDESVRKGGPIARGRRTAQGAAAFTRAMAANSRLNAPAIAKLFSLRGVGSLLDLGGGPGVHSLQFCRENAGLRATVFDFAETLRETRKVLSPHREFERITLHAGDVLTDPLPGRFDVVWISHLIHSMGEGDVRKVLRKAAGAVVEGGRIIIHEFLTNEKRPGPPFASLFRLNMLCATPEGRTYSREELEGWLAGLGFGSFRVRMVPPARASGLIIAKKK